MKKKIVKLMSLMLVTVMGIMMLQGCRKAESENEEKDPLESMTEFTSVDGSVSINLNEKWVDENAELGEESWLFAANKLGTQAVLIMNFPKYNDEDHRVIGLEEAEALVEETYPYSGNETEPPIIPEMYNVEASIGKMEVDGSELDGYIVSGETDYANYVITFYTYNMTESFMENMLISCSSFKEDLSKIENRSTVAMTDTIKWFNASNALILEENNWKFELFAGLPVNENTQVIARDLAEEVWSVTDKETAEREIDAILAGGLSSAYADDMNILTEAGLAEVAPEERINFLITNFEMDYTEAEYYVSMYAMYGQYGSTAILGWDYCVVMELIQYSYLAGFYTETEALERSLIVAQMIQENFDSWDALMESYMNGFEYWAEESAVEYRAMYEELKGSEKNPYAVDFHTALEKTW